MGRYRQKDRGNKQTNNNNNNNNNNNDKDDDDDDDDNNNNDNNNNNNNNICIERCKSRFFYNLLIVPRTASNTYAQVARAQSCANHVQHIGRSSRGTTQSIKEK